MGNFFQGKKIKTFSGSILTLTYGWRSSLRDQFPCFGGKPRRTKVIDNGHSRRYKLAHILFNLESTV